MRRGNKNSQQDSRKDDTPPTESVDLANKLALAEQDDMNDIQANIIAEIQAVRLDVKTELNETIGTLKSELIDFKGEVSTKLNDIASEFETRSRRWSREWPIWRIVIPTTLKR